ncbi:MAG: hypothetical protein MMC23_007239, partial [Stictis urceolatum]|nr:hypothetical protein [Stictis urceolata]
SSSASAALSSSKGLSTGAKAGIGVGAAVLAAAVTCLAWFILHRRKEKPDRDSNPRLPPSIMNEEYKPSPDPQLSPQSPSGFSELHSSPKPQIIAELPATTHGPSPILDEREIAGGDAFRIIRGGELHNQALAGASRNTGTWSSVSPLTSSGWGSLDTRPNSQLVEHSRHGNAVIEVE